MRCPQAAVVVVVLADWLTEPTEQWIYDDVPNVGSELNKRINIVSGLWKPAKLALLGDGNMDWNGSQAAAASSSSS